MVELIFNKKLNSKTIKNEIKEDILSNKESSNFKKHFDKTINNKLKINDKIILSFYADEYPILLTQSEIKDAYLKKYYPHLSKATSSFSKTSQQNITMIIHNISVFIFCFSSETNAFHVFSNKARFL